MLDSNNIALAHKISEEFHTSIKQNWYSLDDYHFKGDKWIDDIDMKYNEDSLTAYAFRLRHNEKLHFAKVNGLSIIKTPYSALIMKGGGIKGLAYVGALEEIEKFYKFNWYAGTSAGAITASLLSCGYDRSDLKTILETKNFKDFKDASLKKAIYNGFTKGGFYESRSFLKWLTSLLTDKLNLATDVRLIDLPHRLTIYASRRDQDALIFDSKNSDSNKISVAFAARCSMSIPILFTPQKSEGLNVMDGGIRNNFPVKKILETDPDADFLGLYLGKEIYEYKKNNVFLDLFAMWMEGMDTEVLRKYDDKIVVIDADPISVIEFNLNKKEKEFLLEAGRLAALRFLNKKKLIDINANEYDYKNRQLEHSKVKAKLKKKRKIRYIFYGLIALIILLILLYLLTILLHKIISYLF